MNKKTKILKMGKLYILMIMLMFVQLSSSKSLATNDIKLILDGQDITDMFHSRTIGVTSLLE